MHAAVSGVGRSKASRTIAAPVTSWRGGVVVGDHHRRHPGGQRRAQPGPGVLDRHRPRRVQPEARQGEQVGPGVGLERGDVVPADHDLRGVRADQVREQRLHPRTPAGRRDRDPHPVGAQVVEELGQARSRIDLPAPDDLDEQLGLRAVDTRGDLVGLRGGHPVLAQRVGDPLPSAGDHQQLAVALDVPLQVHVVLREGLVERDPVAVALGLGEGPVDVEDDGGRQVRHGGVHRAASVRW